MHNRINHNCLHRLTLLITCLTLSYTKAQYVNFPNTLTNVLTSVENAMNIFKLFDRDQSVGSSTVSPDVRALVVNPDGTVTINSRVCQTKQFVTLHDIHRPGGMLRVASQTEQDCQDECLDSPGCKSIDFDFDFNGCFLHVERTVLSSMSGIPIGLIPDNCCVHSYVTCAEDGLLVGNSTGSGTNNMTGPVPTVLPDNCRFVTFFDTSRVTHSTPNLNLSSTAVTLNACKLLCKNTAGCQAIDWNQSTGVCSGYTTPSHSALFDPFTPSNIINNTCCIHCLAMCPEVVTMAPPTPRPVTDEIPLFLPGDEVPGESGECPDPIGRFDNANLPGGSPQAGTFTPRQCKQLCIDQSSCVASDVHKASSTCYLHTSIDLSSFNDDNDCCIHFRKTFCDRNRCISHPIKAYNILQSTPDPYGELIDRTLPDVTEEDCTNGDCFVTRTTGNVIIDPVNGALLIQATTRGCRATSGPYGKTCSSSGSTSECSCSGIRCNTVGPDAISACLVYFPLDMDASDLTPSQRDGQAVNVGFGSTDAKKGRSAAFDGSSYIRIHDFTNYIYGEVNDVVGSVQPDFTSAMWIKRTGTSGDMVIFSNDIVGRSSISLTSSIDSTNSAFHILTGTIKFNGNQFAVTGRVPMNTWQFVVFGTTAKNQGYAIQLYADDASLNNEVATDENTGPSTLYNNDHIDFGGDVVIGAQPIDYNYDGTIQGMNFFEGNIDEFYFFKSQVSLLALRSIRESA